MTTTAAFLSDGLSRRLRRSLLLREAATMGAVLAGILLAIAL
jgi:hypothetical protein